MIVELANGFNFDVAANSTVGDLIVVANDFASLDVIKANFTKDNFATVKVGEESYAERIPTSISAQVGEDETNVVAHFYTRGLTTDEIIASQAAQILELQEALAEIAG